MLLPLILIAWLSLSLLVLLLCAAASRADARAEAASRAAAELLLSSLSARGPQSVPGDGDQPIAAGRFTRRPAHRTGSVAGS